MKKLAITTLAILALSIVSCKKDYTCKCTKTHTSGSTQVITDDGTYPFKDTRTKAESRCTDLESTGTDALGSYTRNCDIQ
jgi:hypothetical protein